MAETLSLPGFVDAHCHAFQRALRGRGGGGDFWEWRELMLGYKAIAPQGYELRVNLVGKAATWLLYLGIGVLIVTHRSTHWPYWIFWAGLVLAVAAGATYAVNAWREVRR